MRAPALETDADGWSISAALGALLPPAPTIIGFCTFRPSRSKWHDYVRPDLLIVPARNDIEAAPRRTATQPHQHQDNAATLSALSISTGAGADTRRPRACLSFSLLCDAINLPCGAGARWIPFQPISRPLWTEQRETDAAAGSYSTTVPWGKRSKWIDDGADATTPPAARHLSTTSSTEDSKWATGAAYHDIIQGCGGASSAALQSFAMQQLGQEAPSLLFLAEKPYTAADENVKSHVVLLNNGGGGTADAKTSAEVTPDFPVVSIPTRRVPVEAYVQRAPLMGTFGTAALQLAMQKALAAAAWLVPRNKQRASCVVCPASTPPHLVWAEREWLVEGDDQLACMEECLLYHLRRCSNGESVTDFHSRRLSYSLAAASNDVLLPLRAWLPTRWSASAKLSMTPMFNDRTEGYDSLSGLHGCEWWRSGSYAGNRTTSCLSPCVETLPTTMKWCGGRRCAVSCRSWVFRLRKSWLVTGLSQATPSLLPLTTNIGGAHDVLDHATSCPSSGSANSSIHLHAVHTGVIRQPNYNLLTGIPLNLLWYWQKLRRGCRATEEPPQEQHTSPLRSVDSRRRRAPKCASRSAAAAKALFPDVCDGEADVAAPWEAASAGTDSCPSSKALLMLSPFSVAAASRRVGWVPLQRVPAVPPGDSHCTPRWSLPSAMLSLKLPTSVDCVRTRLLTDHPSTCLASASAAAASTSLPVAGVSVPQQEWFTGFFAHDAPPWWRRAVRSLLAASAAHPLSIRSKKEGGCGGDNVPWRGQPKDEPQPATDREGNGNELIYELIQMGHIPGLPHATSATACESTSASMESVANADPCCISVDASVGASVSTPMVYVLSLRSRPPRLTSEAAKGGSGDADDGPQLQWSIFYNDHSTATVNYVYSLHDVLQMYADVSPQRRPRGVMASPLFVEVKAAWEVVHRVTTTITTRISTSTAASAATATSSWWPLLEGFYRMSRVEMSDSVAADISEVPHDNHGAPQKEESGDTHAMVSAFCHPTTAEVALAFVHLVTQPADTSTGVHIDGHAAQQNYEEAARLDYQARWPRAAHQTFLHASLAMVPTVTNTAVDEITREAANSIDEEEDVAEESELIYAGSSVSTDPAPAALGSGGAAERSRATHVSATNPPAPPQLPYGVVVQTCDEDGTRVDEGDITDPANHLNCSDDDAMDRSCAETHAGSNCGKKQGNLVAMSKSPAADYIRMQQLDFGECKVEPPSTASSSSSSFAAPKNVKASRTPCTTAGGDGGVSVPRLCLPSAPPVTVTALGEERAKAILAAHEANKRHGCLPVVQRRWWCRQHSNTTGAAFRLSRAAANDSCEHDSFRNKMDVEEVTRTQDNIPTALGSSVLKHTRGECIKRPAITAWSVHTHAQCRTLKHGVVAADCRPATVNTTSPTSPAADVDVVAALIDEEEQRFYHLWRPWLKYLPPVMSQRIDYARGVDVSGVVKTRHQPQVSSVVGASATDPRQTFPFLSPSRLASCHLSTAVSESPSRGTPRDPRRCGHYTDMKNAPTQYHTVQAFDLGLCVLHLTYDEAYINAYNLHYREDAPQVVSTQPCLLSQDHTC
jgi:hypothetical protein